MNKQFLELPVYTVAELYELSNCGHAKKGYMAFSEETDAPCFWSETMNAWVSLVTGDILYP